VNQTNCRSDNKFIGPSVRQCVSQ